MRDFDLHKAAGGIIARQLKEQFHILGDALINFVAESDEFIDGALTVYLSVKCEASSCFTYLRTKFG